MFGFVHFNVTVYFDIKTVLVPLCRFLSTPQVGWDIQKY